MLQVLSEAVAPLTVLEIAQTVHAHRNIVSINLGAFLQQGWVREEHDRPCRAGVIRRFMITDSGHTFVQALARYGD